ADDVIAHSGKVLHAAAADEDHGVLLQVVADAGDVRRDLDAVGEAYSRDLPESGVRLLRRGRVDARAHASLLGRPLERRRGMLGALLLAPALHELVDRRHRMDFREVKPRYLCGAPPGGNPNWRSPPIARPPPAPPAPPSPRARRSAPPWCCTSPRPCRRG